KAQALFDNCFEIVSGPDAPDITIQELDKEVILMLTNDNPLSNNFQEGYSVFDPGTPSLRTDGTPLDTAARSYVFEGYQLYQVLDETVGPDELENPDRARLIAQVDIDNDIDMIVNYRFDAMMQQSVPELKVNGENEGIRHSFQITQDAFAQGDNRLINYKRYYFMAIAYGHNEYEPYNANSGAGQDVPYLASRKSATGSIRIYEAEPHPPTTENGGSIMTASYGDGVSMTRISGKGNGTHIIDITPESEAKI
ncbi:MAG: T9SS C-terminal target domain-containing protein, partial [Flavobacteriales bacterium]